MKVWISQTLKLPKKNQDFDQLCLFSVVLGWVFYVKVLLLLVFVEYQIVSLFFNETHLNPSITTMSILFTAWSLQFLLLDPFYRI